MSNLIPKFKLKNFFNISRRNIEIKDFIENKNNNLIYGELSQSAWSLFLISVWRKKIYNKKNINVFIPEYFCNTALTPLRFLGIDLIFYKLNNFQQPDKAHLKHLVQKKKPDVILVVDYFGVKNEYNFVRDYCINNNSWLVKDSAHSLKFKDNCDDFDFVFYSPHKILSYPMGSILTVNSNGPSKINIKNYQFILDNKNWHLQIQKLLKDKKTKTKNNLLFSLKWFLKRFLQSCGIKNFFEKKKLFNFDKSFNEISYFLNPKIDFFSKFIIFINNINFYEEIDLRLRLSLVLENMLKNLDKDKFGEINYSNKPDISQNNLPYFAVIECANAEKLYNFFCQNNIECITWPDQAKEISIDEYPNSIRLRNERIFVPLFNLSMFKGINMINNFYPKLDKKLKFGENITDKVLWEQNYNKFKKNNLLQMWDYGEFKKKYEKFNVYRYLVRDNLNQVVGLVQILEKKFFNLSFLRINRGPLLKNEYKHDLISLVKEIKKEFQKKNVTFLSCAPELSFNSENIIIDKKHIFKKGGWKSSMLNLEKDQESILVNFKKEWRKDLKKSLNNNNLRISIKDDKNSLDKIIYHYQKEAKIKKFKSININLIKYLNETNNLMSLICELDNEYVGSLCIAKHYPAATNLINPIFYEHRNLNINHLLLWNGIVELKKQKFSFLDTGGFDPDKTPGPTNFKLGLNGENYKLIGDTIIY